jgi:hypothetical protein
MDRVIAREMAALKDFQHFLESNLRLVALESPHLQRIIDLFKKLTQQTGQAIYAWHADQGLYRLGIEHIIIPRTKKPQHAIEYIRSSRHFGVYLLNHFDAELQDASLSERLLSILSADQSALRLIIILDETVELPRALWPVTIQVRHRIREAALKPDGDCESIHRLFG